MESTGAGRGRRRGGRRGGGSSGGRPGWFLHDDRDEPAPGSAVGGGYGQQEEDAYEGVDPAFFSSAGDGITVRISRKGGREVSDTTGAAPAGRASKRDGGRLLVEVNSDGSNKQRIVVVAGKEGWEYQDPGGQVQGPFRATQVIKWLNMQYFDGSLLVRKVSQHGTGHWNRLDAVLKDVQREAALAGAAAGGATAGKAAPRVGGGKGRGAGGGAAHVLTVPVTSPRGASGRLAAPGNGGAGPDVSGYVVSGQRPPRRQQGQAASDLSYFNGIELGGAKAPRGRGGGDRNDYGGRFGGGSREDAGRGRGGRGGARGSGRGEGRGGRGRGSSYGGAAADAAAAERAAVQKLFTGEVALGTEQPMWRYIDPDGNMQGPFPAKDMLAWHEAGYLHDKELPMCGTSRKVSPPNLPTPDYFAPLGALIAYVRSGKRFVAVEVDDIRFGKVPDFLQRLRSVAKPAAEQAGKVAAGKAAAGKAAAGKAAAGKAGKKGGSATGKAGNSAAALAAQLAAAAVRNVLAALGEGPGRPEPSSAVAAGTAGQAEDIGALAASLTAAAFASVLGPATPAAASAPAAQAAAEPAAHAALAGSDEQAGEIAEAPEHEEGEVIGEEEGEQAVAAAAVEEQPEPALAAGPPPLEEAAEPAVRDVAPAAAGAAPAAAAAPPPLEDADSAPVELPALAGPDAVPLPPPLEPSAVAVPPPLEPAGGAAVATGSEAAATVDNDDDDDEEFEDAEDTMASPLPSPAS